MEESEIATWKEIQRLSELVSRALVELIPDQQKRAAMAAELEEILNKRKNRESSDNGL